MWQVIEPPGGGGIIRTWHGEGQPLGKIMAKRQLFVAWIGSNIQQFIGITVGNLRLRIEPLEQPLIEILSGATSYTYPG